MIDIKGIVRNTPPSIGQDGELEDVIGLRRENGAYRPIPLLTPLVEDLPYTRVFIHENAGYTHFIGVDTGQLFYFANLSDGVVTLIDAQLICETDDEPTITQMGNVINIVDSFGLQYAIWYNMAYISIKSNWDGNIEGSYLNPTGFIGLKVDGVIDGERQIRRYLSDDVVPNIDSTEEGYEEALASRKQYAENTMLKALSEAKDDGLLLDFHLVCTAVELYDGSYILHSNPVIIGQAWDKGTRFNFIHGSVTYNYLTNPPVFYTNDVGSEVVGKDYRIVTRDEFMVIPVGVSFNSSDFPNLFTTWKQEGTPVTQKTYLSWNKLQIKRTAALSDELKPLIKSVSVFLSLGVSQNDYSLITSTNSVSSFETYRFQPKTNEDIKKEIEELATMYKVAEYSIDQWNTLTVDTWTDIDLSDKLSTLTAQEELPVDNFTHHTFLPEVQFVYNSALHIANYNTRLSHGFPYQYFLQQESLGQFTDNTITASATNYIFWVKTEIKTEDGISTLAKYTKSTGVSNIAYLNPMLSYPDRRATKMTFYFYATGLLGSNYIYTKEFLLKPHPFLNIAYYIDPDIKPFGQLTVGSGSFQEPGETSPEQYYKNSIKVSNTNNPFTFPSLFTYLVGNGEIRALATNTIALSTGQFGEFPVYVFCSDGIYGLYLGGVEVNYSSVKPISREVINNNNVKAIDNGVVFITDKGVMVISGAQVQEISVPIEGRCFDFTNSGSSDYLQVFRTAVDHDNLVKLLNEISVDDFLTYVSGAVMGYNYLKREVWFTNPAYTYTYIFSRGAWYKVAQTGSSYTSNYPFEYILKETDTEAHTYSLFDISSEDLEASVPTMFLTRPLKLTGQDFKAMITAVIRAHLITGHAEPLSVGDEAQGGTVIVTYENGQVGIVALFDDTSSKLNWNDAMLFCNSSVAGGYTDWYLPDIALLTIIGEKQEEYELEVGDYWSSNVGEDATEAAYCFIGEGVNTGFITKEYEARVIPVRMFDIRPRVGIYIFGSYDCKKWGFLGGGEKLGDIRDLGARTARTDCKFFRIGFVGNIDITSTIDFIELEAKKSITNKKLR